MTYFGFLLGFILTPIAILAALYGWRHRSQGQPRGSSRGLWIAAGIQALLALVYTTPWDNYLVAHGVWRYDPALVSGALIGYVPIEEYAFFVLETLLVASWWRLVSGETQPGRKASSGKIRAIAFSIALSAWIGSTAALLNGWEPATYLTLITSWALIPMMIQLAFGADILWLHRRLVAAVVLPLGLYLCAADALAIRAGIWTISPRQSLNLFAWGLPIEEAVFFFATVIMLGFGLTLSLVPESRARFAALARRWPRRRVDGTADLQD